MADQDLSDRKWRDTHLGNSHSLEDRNGKSRLGRSLNDCRVAVKKDRLFSENKDFGWCVNWRFRGGGGHYRLLILGCNIIAQMCITHVCRERASDTLDLMNRFL